MDAIDVALTDLVFPLTLLIWSAAGVLLALSVREVQAYRRDQRELPRLSAGADPRRRLLPGLGQVVALLTPSPREITWQLPDADVGFAQNEREVAEVDAVDAAPAPVAVPKPRAPERHVTYWTLNAHDIGQGSLKVFDAFVARLDRPTKRRLVLADFDGVRSGDTLHAVLNGDVELNLVVCREMSPNVDLIPHARVRPPYPRFEVVDLVRELEATYDEILILDTADKRAGWADFFALGERGLVEPVVHVPKLSVTPETTV